MRYGRLQDLLTILADGRPHSGEAVGLQLGISRAAVWKLVDQARHAGLEVLAVPGAGYRLPAPLVLLDETRIKSELGETADTFASLLTVIATPSTNEELLGRIAAIDAPHALLAEHQSAGRGRRGRDWHSPMGASLYLSVAWPLDLPVAGLSGLSLAAGLAVAESVDATCGLRTGLKWPNDLYVDNKKIGGILVEVSGSPEGPCKAVVGIGLNCRLPDDDNDTISQPWTDLYRACGRPVDRNSLAVSILKSLAVNLPRFEHQGFAPFMESWNQRDILKDQPVTLMLGAETANGVARGVNDFGALLLDQNGTQRSVAGGDVSLRPARP
ncbi:BirA family biotin operon repressor/biotin-[acetyl-CoA-carboxylase] ligase [Natronocella acetinitrilica]|uniref:Bifunctional ligase/repressor BirA n=1 Tax=Natronocella acetinitrilica TaxID=414046 RepID=A0AAE3G846_9GAMM|nr:bifunctional biotin--[acetyl-CoA-carboxylase] ligase/biotin operon repressor BirA [Natronocella acetinitrilica]MCP1677192.1 BirA family biotin operon repressor/biotin-[acetyl-CoA-carboxylase] ligase [Natronocella acetinitrilica]